MTDDIERCWSDVPPPAARHAPHPDPRPDGTTPRRSRRTSTTHYRRKHPPGADAARVRPRASVPVHLEPEHESRGWPWSTTGATRFRPRQAPGTCSRASSRSPAAVVGRAGRFVRTASRDVVKLNVARPVFRASRCAKTHLFRIIRDTDMVIQEDEGRRPARIGRPHPEGTALRRISRSFLVEASHAGARPQTS